MSRNTELPQNCRVLVVAAGESRRMGGSTPKPYTLLGGVPLLEWSLGFFRRHGAGAVHCVIHPKHVSYYRKDRDTYGWPAPIPGGPTRQESVLAGLKTLEEDSDGLILIHDAARPFPPIEPLAGLIEAAREHGAATLGTGMSDTLHRAPESLSTGPVERRDLYAVQTPQIFREPVLRRAHEAALKQGLESGFTDDASLVQWAGNGVRIVQGSRSNIKLTFPEDRQMAESLLNASSMPETTDIRVGTGFDVHAFAPRAPAENAIRICGVKIPHFKALIGHSDADLGLHVICDALYGAMAEADIGTHFPSNEEKWKNADSNVFLAHAARLLKEKGGRLLHLDVTIIGEAPKIGPHRGEIRDKLSDLLDTGPERISVKATTTQGLGFLGRREGLAAQAAVTIALPGDTT